jgi:hypothetical protein
MASAEEPLGRAPGGLATDRFPVAVARDLIDRARVDSGAAQVAAGAGDYEVAYELLQDAVAAWNRASKTLLELIEAPAEDDEPIPAFDLTAGDQPAGPDQIGGVPPPDDPHTVVGSSDRHTPGMVASSSSATEQPKPARGPESFFRRRRRASPRLDLSGGEDLVLDDLLAVYVHDDDASEAGEYDAWVARLHEKRRQLRASVDEADRWRSISPRTDG